MGSVCDSELLLAHELGSVSRARHWAAARLRVLTGDLPPERLADVLRIVELLTTELVANALEHGSPPLRLGLQRHGEVVRVRVWDGSLQPPVRRDQRADATSGRGVALVENLSSRWGTERTGDGKVVWCELVLDA